MPPEIAQRQHQRQLQREYNRLRTGMLDAYKQLEKQADRRCKGQPRRVALLIKAFCELWRKRGSQHLQTYLGEAALAKAGYQSHSSDKRAKPAVLDQAEGLALLHRTHAGGGRLAKTEGGGKNAQGRFRGNADGFMVGPTITGWTAEDYRRLQAGPPRSPTAPQQPGETDAEYGQRLETARREAFLAQYQARPP